jgi:hypothetical protein
VIRNSEIARRIIGIECPVDKVTDRVIGVLEEYDHEGQYQITSRKDEDYDETRLKYYRAYSEEGDRPDVVMVVKEGMDGYVATVVDAYID